MEGESRNPRNNRINAESLTTIRLSVPFANRYLVSADQLGGGLAHTRELRLHVLHFQLLDRVPVEVEFLGHVLDGRRATAPRHTGGEMFGGQASSVGSN